MQICPRCKAPQKGYLTCEYCGYLLRSESNKKNSISIFGIDVPWLALLVIGVFVIIILLMIKPYNYESIRSSIPKTVNTSQDYSTSYEIDNHSDLFYAPNRAFPYWANEISKHRTRKEAIIALANQFDSPPAWVEKFMGTTNNLTQIHSNLVRQKLIEDGVK